MDNGITSVENVHDNFRSNIPNVLVPEAKFVSQRQDHFDMQNLKRWKQAQQVNGTQFKKGGPVFLCVGGEGPKLTGNSVIGSVHCNVAVEQLQAKGALMLALEHRQYGCHFPKVKDACPQDTANATVASQRFLSSRQAINDVAHFITQIKQEYQLNEETKFITFGGSQPGMLASFARIKFPHLIHAAISSSAPVRAEVEMKGQNDVVSQAQTVKLVGGSKKCRDNIAEGHQQIGNLLKTDAGKQQLNKMFNLLPAKGELEVNQISTFGMGAAYFPAQSNDPLCTQNLCNIRKICEFMLTGDKSNIDKLAELRKAQDETKMLSFKETKLSIQGNWEDQWQQQTCTEFAFQQTCDINSQCMFVKGLLTLDYYLETSCMKPQGITGEQVQSNVQATNEYQGSDRPAEECILQVNGEIDPWKANSIVEVPGQQTMLVPGSSHHYWTHPSNPKDSIYIKKARQQIRDYIDKVLNQNCLQRQI